MPGGWQVYNPRVVRDQLKLYSQEDRDSIADAFELLLEDPYDPPGVVVHPMRGHSHADKFVAHLPDHWFATYTVHPDGLPPLSEPTIVIRSFLRRAL